MNQLVVPAGSLRHTILIQSPSTSHDSFGQTVLTWTTVVTTRAAIKTVSAKELYQTGQLSSQVTHTITVRWPGILVQVAPGMQVVYGPHTYKIQAIDNVDERNRVLKLMCLAIDDKE